MPTATGRRVINSINGGWVTYDPTITTPQRANTLTPVRAVPNTQYGPADRRKFHIIYPD